PLGYVMEGDAPVLDEDTGLPIQVYPAMMTQEELTEVQARLEKKWTKTMNDKCPIAGIVYCLECGARRHFRREKSKGHPLDYLMCPNSAVGTIKRTCHARSVRVDKVMSE